LTVLETKPRRLQLGHTHARADMHRDTRYLVADRLALAGVDSQAHGET
jgi:hypothetical protein